MEEKERRRAVSDLRSAGWHPTLPPEQIPEPERAEHPSTARPDSRYPSPDAVPGAQAQAPGAPSGVSVIPDYQPLGSHGSVGRTALATALGLVLAGATFVVMICLTVGGPPRDYLMGASIVGLFSFLGLALLRPTGLIWRSELTVVVAVIISVLTFVSIANKWRQISSFGLLDLLAVLALFWVWHGKNTKVALIVLFGVAILFATAFFLDYFRLYVRFGKTGILGMSLAVSLVSVFALLLLLLRGSGVQSPGRLHGSTRPEPRSFARDESTVLAPSGGPSGFPLVGEVHGIQGYAQATEKGWRFRLQCYDNAGNSLTPLPVEIPIGKDKGGLFEGDRVEVYGQWKAGRGVRATHIRNLATGAVIEAAKFQAVVWLGYALTVLGFGLCIFVFAQFIISFQSAESSFARGAGQMPGPGNFALFFVGMLLAGAGQLIARVRR